MIDIGIVKDIEYFNVYSSFQTSINNLDTFGGYKILNNVCYIFLVGICLNDTTVIFPNSNVSLTNIFFQKNETIIPFDTKIPLQKGDYIKINVRYEI